MRWEIALLAALLVSAAHGQKFQSSPFHGDEASTGVGKASFRLRCSACHGIHAEGGRGPALDRGEFEAGDRDIDLYRVIENGVPGTEMPAFGARSTEENIWRMVAYLRTFQPEEGQSAGGDAAPGEDLFWNRAGCGGCHRVGSRGGNYGPALTRIGRSRSLAHLRESVLQPDADLPPGYYVVEVETKDGRSLRGIGQGFDDFSVQWTDAAGNFRSYYRNEVASVRREFLSVMPGTYGESLSEQDLADLLTYLQGLRGEGGQP